MAAVILVNAALAGIVFVVVVGAHHWSIRREKPAPRPDGALSLRIRFEQARRLIEPRFASDQRHWSSNT
jgi:hypothetical protein